MASCTTKHIPLPIPDAEWLCPNCGANNDYFYIDTRDSEDLDCGLYPAGYSVRCDSCDGRWALKTIIGKWAKKKDMVACPHCKGTGFVEKGRE